MKYFGLVNKDNNKYDCLEETLTKSCKTGHETIEQKIKQHKRQTHFTLVLSFTTLIVS